MGFITVLMNLGQIKKNFKLAQEELLKFNPDVLILVDYPGFNLRFAAAVRKACPETRIVYYISPKVWAWNKGRIPKMVALLDEMLCLFPFEQPLLENAGLKTTFVGHPLVDEMEAERLADVRRDDSLVGLFPGSREREIARLFPLMVETAKRLKSWRGDLRFEVPAASPKLVAQLDACLTAAGAAGWIKVTTGGSHALMTAAEIAAVEAPYRPHGVRGWR